MPADAGRWDASAGCVTKDHASQGLFLTSRVPENFVAVYACQSRESEMELPLPPSGKEPLPHGLLTLALCEILKGVPRSVSYRDLDQALKCQYAQWDLSVPVPFLEGLNLDRKVLGVDMLPNRRRFPLRRVGAGPWWIDCGRLLGLGENSRLAVYLPRGSDSEKVAGYVRVVASRVLDAQVVPYEHAGLPSCEINVDLSIVKLSDASDRSGTPIVGGRRRIVLEPREWVAWKISNAGATADVTLFFVDSEYRMRAVFPLPGVYGNRLKRGQTVLVGPVRVNAKTTGLERVVLLAVEPKDPPRDFGVLEESTWEGARGRGGAEVFDSGLGRLLQSAMYARGGTREADLGKVEHYAAKTLFWRVNKPQPATSEPRVDSGTTAGLPGAAPKGRNKSAQGKRSAALGVQRRKLEALKGRNNRNVSKVAIFGQPPPVSPFQGFFPDEQRLPGRRLAADAAALALG